MRRKPREPSHAKSELVADLRAATSSDRVLLDPLDRAIYGRDASLCEGDEPAVVVFPATTAETAAVVNICNRHCHPFVARGSGTGLAGNAVPLGSPVVIVTTFMNKILSVDVHGARRSSSAWGLKSRLVPPHCPLGPLLRARPF